MGFLEKKKIEKEVKVTPQPKVEPVEPVEEKLAWSLREIPTQTKLVYYNEDTQESLGLEEAILRILNLLED
ncbi:MAG: hypothetical protein ACTSQ4_02345 [Candidatus Heimdallarchaeaceae archaeon]